MGLFDEAKAQLTGEPQETLEPLTVDQLGQLQSLKEELEAWYRLLAKDLPRLEDGYQMSIKFGGGVVGYGKNDEPLLDILITTKNHKAGYCVLEALRCD